MKKIFKNRIFIFLLGAVIFSTITAGAASLIYSKDVSYDNTLSGLKATTVQGALDELYEKAKNAPDCDLYGICTVSCPEGQQLLLTSKTNYTCGIKFAGQEFDVVENFDGLYADEYDKGRYYYKGVAGNVDNYISFDGDMWRIISIESDGTLKIMKQDFKITTGGYPQGTWTNNFLSYLFFSNEWAGGTVYYNLTESVKKYIVEHDFDYGDITAEEVSEPRSLKEDLAAIKSKTVKSKAGFVSVTDFTRASLNKNCESIHASKYNGVCYVQHNWMHVGKDWWLFPTSDNGSVNCKNLWYVGRDGNVTVGSPCDDDASYLIPAVYIKAGITLSGYGTESNPYTIVS